MQKLDANDQSQFRGDAVTVEVFVSPVDMLAHENNLKLGDVLYSTSVLQNSGDLDGQPVFSILRLERDIRNAFELARRFAGHTHTFALETALLTYVRSVETLMKEKAPEQLSAYKSLRREVGLTGMETET